MESLQRRGITVRGAIAGHSRQTHLHPHMTKALCHKLFSRSHNVGKLRTVGMSIAIHRFATFASCKLVYRHSRLSPFDVPQCLVDAAQRIVEHWSIFPVRAVITALPDVLDPVCCLTQKKWLQIPFDCRLYQVGSLSECCAAISIQAILI